MGKMLFQDGYFNIIVSSLAIHNFINHDEIKKALIEIIRVAKKGCKLAILDITHIEYYESIIFQSKALILNILKSMIFIYFQLSKCSMLERVEVIIQTYQPNYCVI